MVFVSCSNLGQSGDLCDFLWIESLGEPNRLTENPTRKHVAHDDNGSGSFRLPAPGQKLCQPIRSAARNVCGQVLPCPPVPAIPECHSTPWGWGLPLEPAALRPPRSSAA